MLICFKCCEALVFPSSVAKKDKNNNNNNKREMLMSALRALVNNPIKVSFNINFMGNEKKTVKTLIAFFLFP